MPRPLHQFDPDDTLKRVEFVLDPSVKQTLRARLQHARETGSPSSAFSHNGWRRLLFMHSTQSSTDEETDPMNNRTWLIPAFAGLIIVILAAALIAAILLPGSVARPPESTEEAPEEEAPPPTLVPPTPTPAPILIDDFESGSLEGWTVDCRGAGCWYIYDDGATSPVPDLSDPELPFEVPDPPQGAFAAVIEANSNGARFMYRDLELDGPYTLHLTVFYQNPFGFFYRARDLNHEGTSPIMEYRIDLLDPSTPVDSLAEEDILASIFQTKPGDPGELGPTPVSVDLSPWAGQTVRLRLLVVDNFGPLRGGIDDIYLEFMGD